MYCRCKTTVWRGTSHTVCFFIYTYIRIVCTVGGISYVPTKNRMFVCRVGGNRMYLRNWIFVIKSRGFHSQIGNELHLFWWFCERLLYEYPKISPPAARNTMEVMYFYVYISILYAAWKIGGFWREAPKIVYTVKSKKNTLIEWLTSTVIMSAKTIV